MITGIRNPSLVVLAALALTLSACGGGGDGPVTNGDGMMPRDGDTTSVPSTSAEFRSSVRTSVRSRLSSPQVHFGSVAVYVGTEVTGIESSFDGSRVTATINRGSSSPIGLDTADAYEDEGRGPSLVDLPGRRSHVRYVFDHTDNSATLGLVAVDWASNDPTDYLAGGYWVHLASDSSLEVGAFVDGPELSLSDPPELPVSGTASYEGQAAGLYAYRYGTDDPQAATGSEELGEFTGPATLTADFSDGTIGGCIGCSGTVYVSGVTYHRNGQAETFEDHPMAALKLPS